MFLLVLASLVMFGTIAYTITLQDISNYAITYITGLLISVTGILLGLSGILPISKSLERMKLQVTLTITTLLWLVATIMIALTNGFTFTASIPVPNRGRTFHHTRRILLDFDNRSHKTTAHRSTSSQDKPARKYDWLI